MSAASRGMRRQWRRFSSDVQPQSCPTSIRGVNPPASAVVTFLNTAAGTSRAERAVQSDFLPIWHAFDGTLTAPLISARRLARFGGHFALNLFINNRLRHRYSRHKAEAMRDSDLLIYALERLDQTRRSHPLVAWHVQYGFQWARTEQFFRILSARSASSNWRICV